MTLAHRSLSSAPFRLANLAALVAGLIGCGGARAAAPPVVVPEAATHGGEPIYFGSVYPLGEEAASPTYVYERRVAEQGGSLVSTHITREPSGAVAMAESATHDARYALTDYVLHGDQRGRSGTIHVEDGRVVYRLTEDGETRTAVEEQDGTVVVGPTLVGFIATHLDALRAGETFVVRLAILDRMETIGFELANEPAAPRETRIRMTPTSFFIGLAVDPIHYTFETSTKKLVRLEGRVPPKRRVGDRLDDFDARVEYAFVAPAYR